MNNITLTYNGRAQALSAWGLAAPRLVRKSRAPATFTVNLAGGDPTLAPQFSYFQPVTLTNQDTGEILFKGRVMPAHGRAHPQSRGVDFTFKDAWYDPRIPDLPNGLERETDGRLL